MELFKRLLADRKGIRLRIKIKNRNPTISQVPVFSINNTRITYRNEVHYIP